MAVYGGLTQAMINQLVTQKLIAVREALAGAADLYLWTSGLSQTDLVNAGFAGADADSLLSACADANAVAQVYTTGLPPGSYPQPASTYVYAASQAALIGPQ
jgi:hypothetical protein